MLFLYDLPNAVLGLVITTTLVVAAFAGYFVFRRVFRGYEFTEANINLAMATLGALATVTSLLLAFSAVSVWESFGAANEAVVAEANSVSALARDLATFNSPESMKARQMLREYTASVINVEWHDMQRGQANIDVWNEFDRMFLEIGQIEPDTPRHQALLPEIWARANELLKQRRSRLYTSEADIPGTLWAVVLIGAGLTISLTFVLPLTRFNLWIIGTIAMSLGLVFYFIVAMDRPFAGKESISPEAFTIAIHNMERWDTVIAPPPVK